MTKKSIAVALAIVCLYVIVGCIEARAFSTHTYTDSNGNTTTCTTWCDSTGQFCTTTCY